MTRIVNGHQQTRLDDLMPCQYPATTQVHPSVPEDDPYALPPRPVPARSVRTALADAVYEIASLVHDARRR